MRVYAARQPILNSKKNIVAYELFFRNDENNFFSGSVNSYEATSKLIMRTHLNEGLSSTTEGKPALINFCEKALIDGLPYILPKNKIVIEVLESVPPSDEIYDALKKLHNDGYTIAFDDFEYKPEWNRFFKFIKMIKFDLRKTTFEELTPLMNLLKKKTKIKFLAEKIETIEEFNEAKKLGFDFYQGYFFCKPEMKEYTEAESDSFNVLFLCQKVVSSNINMKEISNIFENDVNLSFKLLQYINSGIHPLRSKIGSINQALTYLGQDETRRFVLLLASSLQTTTKPKALLNLAVHRAKFAECIADKVLTKQSSKAFMTGLFSLADAIFDREIETILNQLPLEDDIKNAILEKDQSLLKIIIKVVKLFESGLWHETTKEAFKLNITYKQLGIMNAEAIDYINKFNNIDKDSIKLKNK